MSMMAICLLLSKIIKNTVIGSRHGSLSQVKNKPGQNPVLCAPGTPYSTLYYYYVFFISLYLNFVLHNMYSIFDQLYSIFLDYGLYEFLGLYMCSCTWSHVHMCVGMCKLLTVYKCVFKTKKYCSF